MATAGVLDDGEELASHVGVDGVAGGEEDGSGVFHGVGGVVALGGVVGVVGEEVDGLLAFEVDEAEACALGDDVGPVFGGLEGDVVGDCAGDLGWVLGHGMPPLLRVWAVGSRLRGNDGRCG